MTGFPNSLQSRVPDCRSTAHFSVKRVVCGVEERVVDTVAVEAPLTIYLTYWSKDKRLTENLAVTMRTPGQDVELAAGYLLGEGVISSREEILDLQELGTGEVSEVRIEVAPSVDVDGWRLARAGLVASACGICGKRVFESWPDEVDPVAGDGPWLDADFIRRLPELLSSRQDAFEQTGGLHAAMVVSPTGEIESAFEDVGRHNSLDKVIGHALLGGKIPLRSKILFLSSRSSYELVQKAVAAGAAVLATVGGPSTLAIEAARRWGLTLIGFVRGERFNLYAGEWRLRL